MTQDAELQRFTTNIGKWCRRIAEDVNVHTQVRQEASSWADEARASLSGRAPAADVLAARRMVRLFVLAEIGHYSVKKHRDMRAALDLVAPLPPKGETP